MGALLDYLPSLPFETKPTFRDFILASERVGPTDSLILKNGHLVKKFPNETNEARHNRRIWRAFRHAVQKEFSTEQRERICKRYGFKWERFAYSSKPLERTFVEYFGSAAANPTTKDLERQLSLRRFISPSLARLTTREIHELFEEAADARYVGNWQDPSEVHGGAREPHENVAHVQLSQDQQRAKLFRGIESLTSTDPNIPRLHPYYSRLSMGIVSHLETKQDCKDVGLLIPAPGIREGRVEYYKIHDVISENGLSAVALVPVSKQSSLVPILAFRCTKQNPGQTDFIPSILNNMEKHIGKSGYRSCKEQLCMLMKDRAFTQGKKIKVLAYSQGGGYAGFFLNDFWSQVEEYVGFNTVGNDARIVERMARKINELGPSEIPPAIFHYRNFGDWVNRSGEKHVGWGITHPNARCQVIEWNLKGYTPPTDDAWDPLQVSRWLNIHGRRPMDAEKEGKLKSKYDSPWEYTYHLHQGATSCDLILNTYESDPTLENKRRRDTKILYVFVSNLYSIFDFIFRVFGVEVFRKNW